MFWIKLFFVTIGTLVLLLAAVGMVRLPDVYMRMSAATKGATLGMICLLVAVGLHFQDTTVTARALATIAFVVITAPLD